MYRISAFIFLVLSIWNSHEAMGVAPSHDHEWLKRIEQKDYPTAPDIEGVNLQTGKKISLRELTKQGKSVWVLFWRLHSCGICRAQLSDAELYYPSLKKLGAEILAVSSNAAKDTDDSFRKTVNFTFPIIADPRFRYIDLYKVHNAEDNLARPSTFIVNPQGKIIFAHIAKDISSRISAKEVRDIFQLFFGT